MHAEVMRPLGRVANCFREAATHTPGTPKLLITTSDEPDGSDNHQVPEYEADDENGA